MYRSNKSINYSILNVIHGYKDRHTDTEIYKCQSPLEASLYIELKRQLPTEAIVRCQFPIDRYAADILVVLGHTKMVIEVDGQDYHSTAEDKEKDLKRQNCIKKYGYNVIRFQGFEVFHHPITTVEKILSVLSVAPVDKEKWRGVIDQLEERERSVRRLALLRKRGSLLDKDNRISVKAPPVTSNSALDEEELDLKICNNRKARKMRSFTVL